MRRTGRLLAQLTAVLIRRAAPLILITACAAISTSPGTRAACAEPKRVPNIVLIMADDLGYGDLSCYGGWIETPQIDLLAKQGLRFTDFHSNGAVCSPTRAALVTGRYQQRAGIPGVVYAAENRPEHKHGLQEVENTFAELLGQHGYTVGIFGKWHLGYYPKYNPVKHGFNVFHGYVSGNVDFFSKVDQAGNYDWWHNTELIEEPGYVTHLITKHAVNFIEQNHDRPFCLYVPHEAPHYPYQGPNDSAFRKVGQPRAPSELKMSAEKKKQAYREMVQAMDQGIGSVLSTLAEHHLTENTLVFFCSDNGPTSLGSNGELRGSKGQLWEGGHRVPAIASWPGTIQEGTVTHATCMTMDLMPTMLDLAGIALPKDRPLDGVTLRPLLAAPSGKHGQLAPRDLVWNGQAIRRGPWKLVTSGKNDERGQLYNLANDISEASDISAEHDDLVASLKAALATWRGAIVRDTTPQP